MLLGLKLVGLGIVVWAMAQAGMLEGALQFLVAYHFPFVLPLLALLWSPTRRWCRRLRARFRRRQLVWAEWHVAEIPLARPGQPGATS